MSKFSNFGIFGKKTTAATTTATNTTIELAKDKQNIFNLIIIDESGSMDCISQQTINGCNETIDTICAAQQKFADTQQHFISVYAFKDCAHYEGRYLMRNFLADRPYHITNKNYQPNGCTPLNDAVGISLTELMAVTAQDPKAIGSVTIITDGEENSSHKYETIDIANMINSLKAQGWNFNFIGANINVVETSAQYNIDNCMEFEQTESGTTEMFERERRGKMAFLERVEAMNRESHSMTDEEYRERRREAARGYYEEQPTAQLRTRFTPDHISYLKPEEVFVFGSNAKGLHTGGASRVALDKFGAHMGQAEGLQGHSYAIPSVGVSKREMQAAIARFISFARCNPDRTFLLTRIGCGHSGHTVAEMASLFAPALMVDNIIMPRDFVELAGE